MAADMGSNAVPQELQRECFVTVGATASFQSLINNVLTSAFIDTISNLGYTRLTIQCGPDAAHAKSKARALEESGGLKGIGLALFDFNKLGLGSEMRRCKGLEGKSREGVVICHAGAGTILDAMRLDVPIIVVPNPALLDNHQAELAEELERQGYVTYGHLDNLSRSLSESEEKGLSKKAWPPEDSGADSTGRGLFGVMDEEVGFELSTREILD